MPRELQVIPRVPIAQVGTWSASTGEWDATRAQFAAAVAASRDPSIRAPRIWIDADPHPDERVSGKNPNAGYAVGWAENLSVEDDVLYADLKVPPLLAETMHAHFPSRSIEARREVAAKSGQRYSLVVDGVQLLSRDLPAVETLDDIAELWGMTPDRDAEPVAASRLIVCALGRDTGPTAGPDQPRPEATMPADATTEVEAVDETTDTTATTTEAAAEVTETTTETAAEAEVTEAETQVPAGAPKIPDGFVLVEQGKFDEMAAKLKSVDDLIADKVAREADEFAAELARKGQIAAKSKPKFAARYRKDPEGTRAVCELMPEGVHEPAPTGRIAATRGEDTVDGADYLDDNGELRDEYRLPTPQTLARRRQAQN